MKEETWRLREIQVVIRSTLHYCVPDGAGKRQADPLLMFILCHTLG